MGLLLCSLTEALAEAHGGLLVSWLFSLWTARSLGRGPRFKRKYLPAVAFCSWGEPFKPVSGAHRVGRGLGSSIEPLCVLATAPHSRGGGAGIPQLQEGNLKMVVSRETINLDT